MPIIDSIAVFLVSLLVGGLSIFVAASIVVDSRSYEHALVTAVIAAIAQTIAGWFTGIPLVGELLPLLAWIAVIKWRYAASWINAAIMGFLAWAAAILVLTVLPFAGIDAFGVPFTSTTYL
ncbi:hypothetical protein ACFQAS_05190 [Halopenitus salinus]|uniref:Uncharacterized protein n=1 Tax=Halopenitus salinus TaxID=1198295 RepID=A0ABD5UVE7_9EURY